jgi:outer membrane protein OmpA-like peptidoglycan-associated protein
MALNKDGLKGVNKTNSAQTLGHSKFGIGFTADIATDMSVIGADSTGIMVRQYYSSAAVTDTVRTDATITKFTGASLYPFMSIGLGQVFDFSVILPIYYEGLSNQVVGTSHPLVAQIPINGLTNSGMGDLRLNAKFRAPIPEDEYIMDLALLAGGSINTHSGNGMWVREAEYLGDSTRVVNAFGIPQNEWKVAGLGTVDFRRLESPVPMLFHVNVGYRAPFANYSPVLYYSGAAEIYVMDFFSLWAEIYKESPSKAPANEVSVMEISAGGAIHTELGIELYVAVHSFMGDEGKYATNLQTLQSQERVIQYSGRTSPALYGMVGFSWSGYLIPQDSDKDGVLDKNDKCPDQPEDEDAWEDEDGCPDPDNDKDGIEDMSDKCPIDPEDKDAFMDEDGCPDPDNDGDGVIDIQDRCPIDPETVNGIEDSDGCPESDKDNDGVVDGRDGCPDDAEDKDQFMDMDGCPDPDNDNDAILDATDKCPNVAETKNGIEDADGCPEGDVDGDGILDDKDECPTQAEDRDAFEDKDGCPDEDNDKDGILDMDDKCPLTAQGVGGVEGCPLLDFDKDGVPDDKDECPKKAEDVDAFQDADGCPDPDNDTDGILDTLDKCPLEAETKNGIDDKDGCPELDTDKDGIFDDKDECPTQGEDKDAFQDTDGCPDLDNDKDGILDSLDKCPLQAETANGFKDEDGCPDEKVKPIEDNVTLDGVNFKTGTTELTFESKKVLDKIVEQLQAYPEAQVEIRGHTDNLGKRPANQKLSEGRAKAVVDYFASKGVDMKRMAWSGFADTQPIEDNKTATGRAKNRRIEMYRTK